jgi:hypothetical protein
MRRARSSFVAWPAVALSAVLASACAPMQVHSYAPPEASVATYRSYGWAVGDLGSTGDPRLDSNRFFVERVQRAADAELRRRGYERASVGAPDLMLHIHARLSQRIEAAELDHITGTCRDDCRATVFDEGTLLIDVVDARTDALVWRGWAERTILERVVDDQASMNQVIDKAVTAIFGRLPARSL